MQNFVQAGDTITLTAPYIVASGAGALVGSIFGVACDAYASGLTTAEFKTTGVFNLTKATGALAAGALMYWDNTNKVVTGTASTHKLIGVAILAAASGDATARVRLNGAFIA